MFDAWTSVEVLRRWWHAEHDWETPHAEYDYAKGGWGSFFTRLDERLAEA